MTIIWLSNKKIYHRERISEGMMRLITFSGKIENYDGFSHAYDSPKKEPVGRSAQFTQTVRDDEIVGDDTLHLPSEAPRRYHHGREFGAPHEKRWTKGEARVGSPSIASGEGAP